MNSTYKIFIILIFASFSCKKFIQIPPPVNEIVTSQVFADSADAVSAVTNIYIKMTENPTVLFFGNGGFAAFTGLTGDELTTSINQSDYKEFYSNSISPIDNNTNFNYLWVDAYTNIYQVNACIEGLNASNGISPTLKKQLIAEARFDRAFLYFILTNLYGPVPLVTTSNYQVNQSLAKVSTDSVYKQIIADLDSAQSLIPLNYITNTNTRPNQYAANALLARVMLYRGQWAAAASAATQVIGSNNYSLVADLNSVFLTGSPEAIWQLSPSYPGYETAQGYVFVPRSTSVIPGFIITSALLNSFEMGDKRLNFWLSHNTIGNVNYYYPYKYKLGRDGNNTPLEMDVVLRLSEQYLIRAEAEAEQNDLTDAANDLNIVRSRAGLGTTSATAQEDILKAIYHERQVELFCEWGHRWFDLNRLGLSDSILSTEKMYWQPTDKLFPIPNSEIVTDPFLIQNPGY